jgi:hypothetical protein
MTRDTKGAESGRVEETIKPRAAMPFDMVRNRGFNQPTLLLALFA